MSRDRPWWLLISFQAHVKHFHVGYYCFVKMGCSEHSSITVSETYLESVECSSRRLDGHNPSQLGQCT